MIWGGFAYAVSRQTKAWSVTKINNLATSITIMNDMKP